MSGHSKWHSIKHKKGAADAKRGKIFTKHAKLIAIVAKNGGDPEMNPSLRAAIDNAKADNVPAANIEKAVKKGAGLDKNAASYEEIYYEGFGAAGTALYIHVITDNKNRAVSDVKAILTKKGGNMGAAGSVGWMFERKGVIEIPVGGKDMDEIELAVIDAGAEDMKHEGDVLEVFTDATALARVRDALKETGVEFSTAEITYLPTQTVKIETKEDAKKVLGLIDMLEENEDVADVYCNFDMSEELLEKIG
ncbi:YebC/PmpR family DNA-binding transcriptional regulator [Candidatus Peregrinibacteria bacterium]|jgi:YebC/PmpR family DNA-binding regulatory protein|nr:YebC/PmpR family DNA-binding transcriptional regulator [Candidatus Peregrinibacteria bacterium]MBT4056505.1 YebC/PmpR family DNA-binding transcriptional regulator [Candidatus Peregrinibacteria bacterium]